MKKPVSSKLRKLSNLLPEETYVVQSQQTISGRDVKLSGLKPDFEIEDEKDYVMTVPQYHRSNHYLRIKRIYTRLGSLGVAAYVAKYAKNSVQNILDYLD